ncbi:sulfatase-like hydrolase/transferase [Paraburkholderia diazotrophica]|uniref:Choline-sulfatase n=1 Tax=Paraburkholderia diazotrophica TaxID=667676 RepID=A0A1H7EM61_9BURK|nr:sulfatase-like hydrolase/transferase [Paraburkholderia diazotrophica]SEK11775.1 choline-sulfatase [Paraburkholderia diazotrophica]
MKPSNVLILMADEHNARMLGCAGHPLAKTPNLDALAARGTRFTNAYTNCPICVPARASFATGRYVNEIGYWDNSIAYDGRVQSWGHRLQAAKIPVESIGKLHYRKQSDPVGLDRQHLPMHIKDGIGMVHLSIRRQFPDFVTEARHVASIPMSAAEGESEYTRYDRRIADAACDWLQRAANEDGNWVLFVSFVTPHYPLCAPKEFLDLYRTVEMPEGKRAAGSGFQLHPWLQRFAASGRATVEQQKKAFAAYLALCSFMDAQIGRVLSALQQAGLTDSTRIIYTSDHGESAGARGLWGKSNHYEEAAAIPLIVAGPDVPVGRVCNTPVTLIDAYPSILQAAGLSLEGKEVTRGQSLFDLASLPDDIERVAFSEYHAGGSPSASYMVRNGRFKLIYYVGFSSELFDLETDPEESTNLADDPSYASVVAELKRILRSIVDPEDADKRANLAQRELIQSLGGPEKVMADMVAEKPYTPVPENIASQFARSNR